MSEFDDIADLMAEPPGGHLDYSEPVANGAGEPIHWEGTQPRRVYLRPQKPFDTIRHGTIGAYNNDRCRCGNCRAAYAAYRAGLRKRKPHGEAK